jgi:DNA-nicking Smr family endonuclease
MRSEGAPAKAHGAPRVEPAPASFSEVASAAGVAALPAGPGRIPVPPPTKAKGVRPQAGFVVREDDGLVEGYRREEGRATLGRVRGLPRAQVDLHGLRLEVARRRLSVFLPAERQQSEALVLVVVGKGRHSPRGDGVLRRSIGELLTTGEAARHVLAFRTAPRTLGGDGAVLVLLLGRPR